MIPNAAPTSSPTTILGIRSVPTTSSSGDGLPRTTFTTSPGATKLSPTQRYATQTAASTTTRAAATSDARRWTRKRARFPIRTTP